MRTVLLSALLLAGAPAGAEVVAFTLSSMPMAADGATVHVLDDGGRLASSLGTGLPADPDEALTEIGRRLASAEGRAALARIEAAATGNALASRLGIGKLPAVVVDRRYVVYGVRDVRRARGLVADWRARRENRSAERAGSVHASPAQAAPGPLPSGARGAPAGERP